MTALSKHVSVTILATWLVFSTVLLPPTTAFAAPKKPVADNGKHFGQEKKASEQAPDEASAVDPITTKPEAKPPTAVTATMTADTSIQSAIKAQDPRGNNGTVKIDRTPFDNHPDNQPHVTCSFQVDFYGFDRGVGDANVNFALHNPTLKSRTLSVVSGDLTPDIGQDAAGGGTDIDASETYRLAFTGAPHDKQGYHVKLTINAPGSQGSDIKHKVFWVQPCATPTTPTTPTTPQTPGNILGEAASVTRPAVLPASLPSTGGVNMFANFALSLIAGSLYYVLARRHNTSFSDTDLIDNKSV